MMEPFEFHREIKSQQNYSSHFLAVNKKVMKDFDESFIIKMTIVH